HLRFLPTRVIFFVSFSRCLGSTEMSGTKSVPDLRGCERRTGHVFIVPTLCALRYTQLFFKPVIPAEPAPAGIAGGLPESRAQGRFELTIPGLDTRFPAGMTHLCITTSAL